MRAVIYSQTGGPEVLRVVDRPEPEPAPGDVVVRVAVSGVNPTDWKVRKGARPGEPMRSPETVPNQDGAGTIVAVGPGVGSARVGERVWLWEAAHRRSEGTAQELVAIPSDHAVTLPTGTSFDIGASLGIPAITAHRALTVAEEGPTTLGPDTLVGRTVLVAGGAGAVGHAAIQLARWAGATVITTVSSPSKGDLARAAGAHHVVNYRTGDAAAAIHEIAPDGVDVVVEVAPVANAALDAAVIARHGTVAIYASEGDEPLAVPVRPSMTGNVRYQFILVYTMPDAAKRRAVRDVSAAVSAGVLDVGQAAGLPLHRFPLERTADARAAVEAGAVGKVLIDVDVDVERPPGVSLAAAIFPPALAAGAAGDPGVVGPDGTVWRVLREKAILAGGPAALLLQVAHPLVAAGVVAHSDFESDPLGRLRQTLDSLLTVVFGDSAQAQQAVAAVAAVHRPVRGVSAGGAPYRADDPEFALWVFATLVLAAIGSFETFVGPLDDGKRAEFYAGYQVVGHLFGVTDEAMPATYEHFTAYVRRVEDEVLVVGDDARAVARAIFDAQVAGPTFWSRATMQVAAAALLPPAIRRDYAIPWGRGRRLSYAALRRVARPGLRLLPGRARYWQHYREARRRLA